MCFSRSAILHLPSRIFSITVVAQSTSLALSVDGGFAALLDAGAALA
jgi:hypothetical protein